MLAVCSRLSRIGDHWFFKKIGIGGPDRWFLHRRRNRVVGLTIERTFFKGVKCNRLGGFVTAQGRCLAAREFRERSEKNGKIWFFRKKSIFADGKIWNLSKIDERSMETYQIDPRGHVGTRNSEICSYWVVHRPSKTRILMWYRRVMLTGWALLPNSGSLISFSISWNSVEMVHITPLKKVRSIISAATPIFEVDFVKDLKN